MALLALALFLVALFTGLGVWQVQRRAWKLDLIARVDQRVHAAPAPAPGPGAWAGLTRDNAEYRRVRIAGTLLNDRETLVQAVTEQGGGYWVMTPLRTRWGSVFVNRGFVPPERRSPASRAAGELPGLVAVTGLLRFSEPGGGFLRSNRPDADRWYSRDVAAIARARGVAGAAPYFIDADATPVPGGWPQGGLTVVSFRNAHLQYALTWFGLALLSLAGAWIVWRRG
ncbi:SURF1 family protein [Sphingomonas ginkgonis]|uniref:SURF1-like protein n=1 Tax=Sphingomonas ginkgonis TaxID=2315330 RepID=A0A3R9WR22_9SPHN|nr:SURF1 family protein [Sphingomonas ginkgonis]RST32238.1 SURF1 family protein [Sphingomonas ginkgonis]